jgi:hypothetical protein
MASWVYEMERCETQYKELLSHFLVYEPVAEISPRYDKRELVRLVARGHDRTSLFITPRTRTRRKEDETASNGTTGSKGHQQG